ncbi:MAG: peroxide stress protein YaaA, partial [Acidimicrobiia bacterium]|nr:peroxide stress protein YaaA [Acidimicrobiia bacterium]
WGAVRLADRIPPYRLNMCGRLPGLAHLPVLWQAPLAEVLPAAAGKGLVVDCRSADYVQAWRPQPPIAGRTVVVKVVRDRDGGRGAVSHNAKHTRGLVARRIVVDGLNPTRPAALAEGLSAHFDVDLQPPDRPGRPWELQVVEPAP